MTADANRVIAAATVKTEISLPVSTLLLSCGAGRFRLLRLAEFVEESRCVQPLRFLPHSVQQKCIVKLKEPKSKL